MSAHNAGCRKLRGPVSVRGLENSWSIRICIATSGNPLILCAWWLMKRPAQYIMDHGKGGRKPIFSGQERHVLLMQQLACRIWENMYARQFAYIFCSETRVEDELDNSIQSRYKNASKAVNWRYYCRTPQVDIPSWNSHQLHLAKFQTAHHGRLRECKGAPAREHRHGQEELVSHDKWCPCPHDKAKATRKRSKDLDSTQAGNRHGILSMTHFVTEHDVLRLGPSLNLAVMGSPPKVAVGREACLNHAKQCEAGFCEPSWPDLPVETSPNTINCWKIWSSDTSHSSGLEK